MKVVLSLPLVKLFGLLNEVHWMVFIYHESRCVGKNTTFSVDIAVFFLQMTHKICSISKRVSAHRANKLFSVVFASKMAL